MALRLNAVLVSAMLLVGVHPLGGQVAGGTTERGWTHATPGYLFEFPRDHASHPDYRVEWWYYTGNVIATDGRRFGYQVTFFRVGIDPAPENPSVWSVRDLFMAHLAVTDMASGRHDVAERLNRGGVGWAGAATDTLNVWNEGWRVRLAEDGVAHELVARDAQHGFGVQLRLESQKPPVLHGRDGFSQKGSEPGNASQYYSLTRLRTTGLVIVDGEEVAVEGLSWMDHEFSTSFLEPGQQGWDWFSLQLDDETDVMLYVLRHRDGTVDPHSGGTIVSADGSVRVLRPDEYQLDPGRVWRSSTSDAAYPVEWTIEVPSVGLELEVRAAVDEQELHTDESTGVTYWEGAVVASGTKRGRAVSGRGYLEMTGYAGLPMSEVLR